MREAHEAAKAMAAAASRRPARSPPRSGRRSASTSPTRRSGATGRFLPVPERCGLQLGEPIRTMRCGRGGWISTCDSGPVDNYTRPWSTVWTFKIAAHVEPEASSTVALDAIDEYLSNIEKVGKYSPELSLLRGRGEILAFRDSESGRPPAFLRIIGQSRRMCRAANGNRIAVAPLQRMKASVIGGTCPATNRPSTVLPAQIAICPVMARASGEARNTAASATSSGSTSRLRSLRAAVSSAMTSGSTPRLCAR